MATPYFDHERLEVYHQSLAFVAWVTPFLDSIANAGSTRDQLDRASVSIPLNIAEGNGRHTPKDRCRFLDAAYGSALECAAALDVLVAKSRCSQDQVTPGKLQLQQIVRMLIGLLKHHSEHRFNLDPD